MSCETRRIIEKPLVPSKPKAPNGTASVLFFARKGPGGTASPQHVRRDINIAGTRLTVINNRMTDVGGGGIPGFIVDNLTNGRIEGDTFTYSGKGSVDGRILITGTSKGNVYRDNRGFGIVDNTN